MMAVDADNNKIYFGSNGTWYNSEIHQQAQMDIVIMLQI